jgi:hypothetical protein
MISLIKGAKAYASHRDGDDRIIRGTNRSELIHKLLKKYIPKTVSVALVDMILALFFMEHNYNCMVNFSTYWPPELLQVSARSLPYLLNINTLSLKLGIESPVPKLPFVNDKSEGIFGWAGSKDFFNAASIGKQLKTEKPSEISDDAVEMVMAEIQESQAQSTTFDNLILAVESRLIASTPSRCDLCPQPSSSSSSSSSVLPLLCDECTQQSEIALNSASILEQNSIVLTSPDANPKRKQKKESNKGKTGSHKEASGKLKLTTKECVHEHPTAQTFLYQHGDLSLFSGCTAIERRYIRYIVLGMTGYVDIADVDIKKVDKDFLWKVFFISMYHILSDEYEFIFKSIFFRCNKIFIYMPFVIILVLYVF